MNKTDVKKFNCLKKLFLIILSVCGRCALHDNFQCLKSLLVSSIHLATLHLAPVGVFLNLPFQIKLNSLVTELQSKNG